MFGILSLINSTMLRSLVLFLLALPNLTTAFPSGAGGCDRNGQGSVEDAHLDASTVVQGSLADGNFEVLVGATLETASVVTADTTIEAGVETSLFVRSRLLDAPGNIGD